MSRFSSVSSEDKSVGKRKFSRLNRSALSIVFTSAYRNECAVGPQYWCQSFQNAQDCGALRHCTDTVWRYDQDQTQIDSTTSCQWCENILANTHKGIMNLAEDEVKKFIQKRFLFWFVSCHLEGSDRSHLNQRL